MKRLGWLIVSPTDIASNIIITFDEASKQARQFLEDMDNDKIARDKSNEGYTFIGDDDEVVEIWEVLQETK